MSFLFFLWQLPLALIFFLYNFSFSYYLKSPVLAAAPDSLLFSPHLSPHPIFQMLSIILFFLLSIYHKTSYIDIPYISTYLLYNAHLYDLITHVCYFHKHLYPSPILYFFLLFYLTTTCPRCSSRQIS